MRTGSALRHPMPGVLPAGGFVLADARSDTVDAHTQVFDALGRSPSTFRVGGGIQ
ncbi:hypothetical protein [Streptomyces sp. NPDC001652]|uniref:hypothetical protein n=1 Tax=Streptomyces sp. NPDC001652 TaxID=3154393 RepID=UPI00332A6D8E